MPRCSRMSGHCRRAMLRNRVVMAQYWSKDFARQAIDRGRIHILDDEFVDQRAKFLGQRAGVGGRRRNQHRLALVHHWSAIGII